MSIKNGFITLGQILLQCGDKLNFFVSESHVYFCFYQGISVDEKRIKSINALADKLISQGRTDTSAVKEKRNHMNQKFVVFTFHLKHILVMLHELLGQ